MTTIIIDTNALLNFLSILFWIFLWLLSGYLGVRVANKAVYFEKHTCWGLLFMGPLMFVLGFITLFSED